jgi:hypothetical protein
VVNNTIGQVLIGSGLAYIIQSLMVVSFLQERASVEQKEALIALYNKIPDAVIVLTPDKISSKSSSNKNDQTSE